MDFLDKYPRTQRLIRKTGFTLDQALQYTELELKKRGIKP